MTSAGGSKITRFEAIEAWQRARDLTRRIYSVSEQPAWARQPSLRDQIQRAAVSVVSNIAEGFERDGNREFRQFLSQAKGSAGEVKAQLYVALDVGLLAQAEFDDLYRVADDTGRLIGGFMRYLAQAQYGGVKFRTSPRNPEPPTRNSKLETRNP